MSFIEYIDYNVIAVIELRREEHVCEQNNAANNKTQRTPNIKTLKHFVLGKVDNTSSSLRLIVVLARNYITDCNFDFISLLIYFRSLNFYPLGMAGKFS